MGAEGEPLTSAEQLDFDLPENISRLSWESGRLPGLSGAAASTMARCPHETPEEGGITRAFPRGAEALGAEAEPRGPGRTALGKDSWDVDPVPTLSRREYGFSS